jgi:hypothetical protein
MRFVCIAVMLVAFSNVGYAQSERGSYNPWERSVSDEIRLLHKSLDDLRMNVIHAAQIREDAARKQSYVIASSILVSGLLVAGAIIKRG